MRAATLDICVWNAGRLVAQTTHCRCDPGITMYQNLYATERAADYWQLQMVGIPSGLPGVDLFNLQLSHNGFLLSPSMTPVAIPNTDITDVPMAAKTFTLPGWDHLKGEATPAEIFTVTFRVSGLDLVPGERA